VKVEALAEEHTARCVQDIARVQFLPRTQASNGQSPDVKRPPFLGRADPRETRKAQEPRSADKMLWLPNQISQGRGNSTEQA